MVRAQSPARKRLRGCLFAWSQGVERLPTEVWWPYESGSTGAISMRTFAQSHSNSSASLCEHPVVGPWPISALGMRKVTESSVPMRMYAFACVDCEAHARPPFISAARWMAWRMSE